MLTSIRIEVHGAHHPATNDVTSDSRKLTSADQDFVGYPVPFVIANPVSEHSSSREKLPVIADRPHHIFVKPMTVWGTVSGLCATRLSIRLCQTAEPLGLRGRNAVRRPRAHPGGYQQNCQRNDRDFHRAGGLHFGNGSRLQQGFRGSTIMFRDFTV
jgi:hypothetical protein